MKIVRVGLVVLGCAVAVSAPTQARGEAAGSEVETGVTGPLVWNLGGTVNVPLGDSSDRVNVGGGFTLGLTYNPHPVFGVQLEYGLDYSTLKTGTLANNGIHGNAWLQYFDLNAVLRSKPGKSKVGVYVLGGGGIYYRNVDVTRVTGTTVAPYCDPWLLYCSAVPVTASSVVGSRTSWDWGVDAGVGLTYAVAPTVRVYLEVRYHYIWGPSFTKPGGGTQTANGQYLPITLGVRF